MNEWKATEIRFSFILSANTLNVIKFFFTFSLTHLLIIASVLAVKLFICERRVHSLIIFR